MPPMGGVNLRGPAWTPFSPTCGRSAIRPHEFVKTREAKRRAEDPRAAVSALIVANNLLERVLGEVYAKASRGFLRGRHVRKTKDSPSAAE